MTPESVPERKEFEPTPRLTLCLAMDLLGSTTAALHLSSKRLDRFNLALINQLNPHLKAVGMEDCLIKFTGDGWLVMSDVQSDVAPLCCLAVIMASQFQAEISRQASMAREKVPAMRLALCWGRDLEVILMNGQRDFVGGSVRHAVRALQLCDPNEVLIDETVRTWISHDFYTSRVDIDERCTKYQPEKFEESQVLHRLDGLKAAAADDHDAPLYFVNTLSIIGRSSEAGRIAKGISDQLQQDIEENELSEDELRWRWNRLLASNVDYETARAIFDDLHRAGLKPDVSSLNALIDKATDYRTESKWLQAMIQEGVRPNVYTYNTLIDKARDKERIQKWMSRMEVDGVDPNLLTLNILLNKAKDYATAKTWYGQIVNRGIAPNAETYQILIQKSESFETAQSWLGALFAIEPEVSMEAMLAVMTKDMTHLSGEQFLTWYLGLRWHPSKPVHRVIAAYRKANKLSEALRVALDYPHTQIALKLFREHPDESLEYFRRIVSEDSDHANGHYALGLALTELGNTEDAIPVLNRALELAAPGHRREELTSYLDALQANFGETDSIQ